jgi:hypothetical protein
VEPALAEEIYLGEKMQQKRFDFVSIVNMFLEETAIAIEQKGQAGLLSQAGQWRQVAQSCQRISAALFAVVGPEEMQNGGGSRP